MGLDFSSGEEKKISATKRMKDTAFQGQTKAWKLQSTIASDSNIVPIPMQNGLRTQIIV